MVSDSRPEPSAEDLDLDDQHTIRPARTLPCPVDGCDYEATGADSAGMHLERDHGDIGRYGPEVFADGGQREAMERVALRLPKPLLEDIEQIAEEPGSYYESRSEAMRDALRHWAQRRKRTGGEWQ